MPRHAQAEIIEQWDAESDSDTGVEDCGCVDHLVPATREVEEGWTGFDGGDREDGDEEEDREGAEETFVTDG